MVEPPWREALRFMRRDPDWARKVAWGGLLMLCLPPLGWVVALGYRSATGERLVEGRRPLLPEWRGNLTDFVRRGLKSVAVILTYYVPLLVAYVLLAISAPGDLVDHAPELLLFFALIAAFPPLFLPTLPFVFVWRFSWMSLTLPEVAVLAGIFLGVTFTLPAAFSRIALEGTYAAAYRPRRAITYLIGNFVPYCRAWILSLAVSAAAVATVVLAPWALFWSYLVILFAFTEALSRVDDDEVKLRFGRSALLPLGPAGGGGGISTDTAP